MEKRISEAFNKKIYLLGRNRLGKLVWLKEPSWDCGWYWGFGYMEIYTNDDCPRLSRDIETHTHFDMEIINGKSHSFDNFKEYFIETPLNNNEIWLLCDYMNTFYTLKKSAEIFERGGSHYTEKAFIEEVQNKDIYEKINKEILPALFDRIQKLLGGDGCEVYANKKLFLHCR